jgi:hypothetical protein
VTTRISYEQAAVILGCHCSNVAKLIRKGELTSTGKRGASLSREQVEALAERRTAELAARAARSPRKYQRVDPRPTVTTSVSPSPRLPSCSV